MLLYAEHTTERLRYILDFLSRELLIEPAVITTNIDEFRKSKSPRINYSHSRIDDGAFQICPVPLLFENEIRKQEVKCFEFGNQKAFFPTEGGDFPFDILAASFYLLTRYEEYPACRENINLPFDYEESIAYQNDFLDIPLVNYWMRELKTAMLQKFPDMFFSYRRFKFIPTYNIERAYAYTNRGWRKNMVKDLRMIMKGEWNTVMERKAVFNGRKSDPFDAYEWLDALHLYCRLKPHYFFFAENEHNHANAGSKAFHQLIAYYSSAYKIGLHISSPAFGHDHLLKEEVELLGYLAGKEILHSRFNPMHANFNSLYRTLIAHGIQKDHSMGYKGKNGFRASVASSFYWFDLERNETTGLLVFPFCFSDTCAYYEQRLSAPLAFQELMHYYNSIKAVNGLMITIWHNQFLGNDPAFKGWKDVYEIFLKDEVYWD